MGHTQRGEVASSHPPVVELQYLSTCVPNADVCSLVHSSMHWGQQAVPLIERCPVQGVLYREVQCPPTKP